MRDIPDNSDDMIDSQDVESRIDELDGERGALVDTLDDAQADVTFASHGDGDPTGELTEALEKARKALAEWDASDEADELKSLKAFRDEAEPYCSDWHHGETLIRESYFEEYVRGMAEEIHGEALRNASWPFDCIDWDRATDQARMDYSTADFGGITYLFR